MKNVNKYPNLIFNSDGYIELDDTVDVHDIVYMSEISKFLYTTLGGSYTNIFNTVQVKCHIKKFILDEPCIFILIELLGGKIDHLYDLNNTTVSVKGGNVKQLYKLSGDRSELMILDAMIQASKSSSEVTSYLNMVGGL